MELDRSAIMAASRALLPGCTWQCAGLPSSSAPRLNFLPRRPRFLLSSGSRSRSSRSAADPAIRLSAMNKIRRTAALRAHSAGRGHRPQVQQLTNGDGDQEPFWLTLLRDAIWGFRFLASFLAEQPGQLKYIEWPSFQTTLKTATLTLVLVAVLIVALSSIDSGLCYVLALVLRRPA